MHHFIRKGYDQKKIETKYEPTEDMAADLLIKALFGSKHHLCVENGYIIKAQH
jgi:hypothetical protein